MKQNCIAILGKQDKPTDAVEEYCHYLGGALLEQAYDLKIERVTWGERGWAAALRMLRHRAKDWRGAWVLVQYTALAWSARGLPLRFLRVLKTLKAAGARAGIVYHDVEPYGGTRVIDRLRRRAQLYTMRAALRVSDAAIFTVPTEKLSWFERQRGNAFFIPVGANLPAICRVRFRKPVYKIKHFAWDLFIHRTASVRDSLGLRRKFWDKSSVTSQS
jgi:hypothetical protein